MRGAGKVLTFSLAAIASWAAEHHGRVIFGGLPVPGATVTASQGQKKLSAITDAQGLYSFADLPDGTWTIQVGMLGFATIQQDVSIEPGAPSSEWNLRMLPLEEMHAVMPSPPAASTSDAAPELKGKSRDRKAAPAPANTPAPFQRADVNAAQTNSAAVEPGAPENDPFSNQSLAELSRRAADGFLINGTANNGASSPFALPQAFGNNRRGPRSLYNGNVGLIFDSSALDARPFSLTGQDTPRPDYNRMQGVFAFGGPVKIPHIMRNGPNFFVNYQWTRNRNASAATGLVPTEGERGGDLSQAVNPLGQAVQLMDPFTGLAIAGNLIPASRISAQAKALLALYPLPNFSGSARYNYQIPITGNLHQDSLQTRLNKMIARKDQLAGTFALQSARSDSPNLFGFLDTGDRLGLNLIANWRHNFTPRFFTTIGYQFSRFASRQTPYFANREDVSGQAGITGNNHDRVNWGPPSLSFASGISGLSDGLPSFARNQTGSVSLDNLWARARHNISFGGDVRRQQFNLLAQQDPRGKFSFTGAAAGSDFAGFLLGVPDTSAIAFGNADKYFRATTYEAYINDDWRISPGFTLNAGVRWEYWSPITEKYGRLVNLDIAPAFRTATPVVASSPIGALTGQKYPGSLLHPDKRAIQPRVAFAWRPLAASSMVIRAGYGVYYNTSVYLALATEMAQQSPLSKSLSLQNSASNPLTLADGFNALPGVTSNTFAVDPNFRPGYSQNWQLSVQQDLPGALVFTALYLGSKGTRELQEFLPNTYPLGTANPCPSCPTGFVYVASNGNSSRHAGQIQLRRRLQSGFTAVLEYTFSKSIDDAALGGRNQAVSANQSSSPNQVPPANQVAPVIAQNWLALSAERGLSTFDQRHQLNAELQYTTGMGLHGGTLLTGWRSALLKEWTIASQITAASGLPLTPVYFTAVEGTGITGSIRPDYTGVPLYNAPSGFFLNPAAYTAPAAGQWGNAGRNSITGPSQFTFNASLGRVFRASERLSLDFRVDAANALNHVTFPSWNTTVTSAQFGLPNSANPMRSIQTTLRLRF